MRARMAIISSELTVEIREVSLQNKPKELVLISEKATVPLLQLNSIKIIDESLDIMLWAFSKNDPDSLHHPEYKDYRQNSLIAENDTDFKKYLDHYKYADRFPLHNVEFYREQAESFIKKLDEILKQNNFLMGATVSCVDYAIFPFIRQFAQVDTTWFEKSPYTHLQKWLEYFLVSTIFSRSMQKYPPWKNGDSATFFPPSNSGN